MSVLAKGLAKAGVELVADSLPPKQRTVKQFQRVIAGIRAAEAEVLDHISEAERRCNEAQQRVIELQDRCQRLESEVLRFRLHEKLGQIESLTYGDRMKVLAAAPDVAGAA